MEIKYCRHKLTQSFPEDIYIKRCEKLATSSPPPLLSVSVCLSLWAALPQHSTWVSPLTRCENKALCVVLDPGVSELTPMCTTLAL